jgi:predicted translin family RNA/ssDNA-binding protein
MECVRQVRLLVDSARTRIEQGDLNEALHVLAQATTLLQAMERDKRGFNDMLSKSSNTEPNEWQEAI